MFVFFVYLYLSYICINALPCFVTSFFFFYYLNTAFCFVATKFNFMDLQKSATSILFMRFHSGFEAYSSSSQFSYQIKPFYV